MFATCFFAPFFYVAATLPAEIGVPYSPGIGGANACKRLGPGESLG
jgi:hypothetical protein